jgi:hypothetical protein
MRKNIVEYSTTFLFVAESASRNLYIQLVERIVPEKLEATQKKKLCE